jgi:hypothetical protein
MTMRGITILRIVGGKYVEGWASEDISRSEEEQRWLSEGGRTNESYLEGVANLPLAEAGLHHSVANEALVRNLTWRFRAAEAPRARAYRAGVASRPSDPAGATARERAQGRRLADSDLLQTGSGGRWRLL